MSQTSFLESVVTWDETLCKQNLRDALPKLISHLEEAAIIQEEIGILKIICVSFLPWVKIQEAEDFVFHHISSKSSCMLDKVIQEIGNLPKHSAARADFQELLEIFIELLDCFTLCIKMAVGGGHSVELSTIHSLPHGAIHLLKGTYSHCKDSSDIYGEVLAYLTEPLSLLFKKAHALQVAVLGLLETVAVNSGPSEQDVEDLCCVCQGLFEVCQIVSNLDVKLVVGLWKAISRLSGKYKKWVKDGLDVDTMVTYLCSEVKKGHKHLLQLAPPNDDVNELSLSQSDTAAFQKSLKVLGYQMRVVISLVESFIDTVSECVKAVVDMIYTVTRGLPPTVDPLNISATCVDDIKRNLTNGVEPLISLLVQNRTFVAHVIVHEVGSDDKLGNLQLLLKIADILPKRSDEVLKSWMCNISNEKTWSLFDLIFSAVSECYVEMCADLMVSSAKELPLYEYVCTHVCGLVGSLPAKYYGSLEVCLVRQLFTADIFTSCLADDIWCFMARFGSADLCFNHTKLLIDLCTSTDFPHCVVKLLKRLVKFLAPDHQAQIMSSYLPESNTSLWFEVLVPVLSTISPETTNLLYKYVTDGMSKFIGKEDMTYSNVFSLLQCLKYVVQLSSNNEDVETEGKGHSASVMTLVSQLLELWDREWTGETIFYVCFSQLTELCGLLVHHLGNEEFLKILSVLGEFIKYDCDDVKIAACTFLCRCKKVKFAPDAKQPQILKKIVSLYNHLLQNEKVLIQQAALESFTQFAETTPYEALVPECLGNNQDLQDKVVAFLSKTLPIESDFEIVGYIRHQSTQLQQHYQRQGATLATEQLSLPAVKGDMLDDIRSDEPSLKRKRYQGDDVSNTDDIQSLILDLEKCVSCLEVTCKSQPLPQECRNKIQTVYSRLKTVLEM